MAETGNRAVTGEEAAKVDSRGHRRHEHDLKKHSYKSLELACARARRPDAPDDSIPRTLQALEKVVLEQRDNGSALDGEEKMDDDEA